MVLPMYENESFKLLTNNNKSRMEITHACILSKLCIVNSCHKYSYDTHNV